MTISERLCKSERTVEKHVSSIFVKLGLGPSCHPELDRRVATARIIMAERAGECLRPNAVDPAAG